MILNLLVLWVLSLSSWYLVFYLFLCTEVNPLPGAFVDKVVRRVEETQQRTSADGKREYFIKSTAKVIIHHRWNKKEALEVVCAKSTKYIETPLNSARGRGVKFCPEWCKNYGAHSCG